MSKIVQNVFDFDQYEKEVKELLIQTLQKHGIPVGLESDFMINLGVFLSFSFQRLKKSNKRK